MLTLTKRYSLAVMALVMLVLGAEAKGQKIAVVNLPVVSDKYERRAVMEAAFRKEQETLLQKKDELQRNLTAEVTALEQNFKPGTKDFENRRRDLTMTKQQIEYDLMSEQREIETRMAASLRKIFDDIRKVVTVISEEQDIDIVIAVEELPDEPVESPAIVRQQIVLQKAVYWKPKLDISDAVAERLNRMYQEEKERADHGAVPAADDKGTPPGK